MKCVPCMDCGEYYPPFVMDFDHLRNKTINIADAAVRWTDAKRLLEEIAKCDCVCANCHRVRTYIRRKRMTEANAEVKKMSKEDVANMLRTRTKKDGTPFKKHEGPRKQKGITADGLKAALMGLENQPDAVKIALVQSFGVDGRHALRGLIEKNPDDKSLEALFKAAFPGAGTGRPYLDSIKTTTDGKAVVSGFDEGIRVRVTRNDDGTVLLTPLAKDSAESQALDAADAALNG